jgi:ubiquinone/menaquinone biosynthesis C-methylase UbiE
MLTRWDEWYSKENLNSDERILAAPASKSAEMAVVVFILRGKKHILDLACGVARDTFHLKASGLSVIGVDASFNGLRAASQKSETLDVEVDFVNADARYLPFSDHCFDGIYCFGLLHEFTALNKVGDVNQIISEARRLLNDEGMLILTVAAGDLAAGLPQVQLFSRLMLEKAMDSWEAIEIQEFDDIGCTNRTDYHIWYGVFEK